MDTPAYDWSHHQAYEKQTVSMCTFQTCRLYLFSSLTFSRHFAVHMIGSWYASVWLLNRFFSCLANVLKNNVLILCRILRFNFTLLAFPMNELPWMLIFPLAFQNLTKVLCHTLARGSFQPPCSNAVGSHAEESPVTVYAFLVQRRCTSREAVVNSRKDVSWGNGGRKDASLLVFPLWKT